MNELIAEMSLLPESEQSSTMFFKLLEKTNSKLNQARERDLDI